MEYVFLFAIVTPLALLVLNLTGFRAGQTPSSHSPFEATVAPIIPSVPVAPAVETQPAPDTAVTAEARGIGASLVGALGRGKRHRRDYFGDYSPMSLETVEAPAPMDDGAEIYLMPRRDDAHVAAPSGPPSAHARPGGTLVPLPRHTPLVTTRSVAQR